ncbi:MAG: hypothetical protein WCJ39_03090 [bacterium]
MHVEEDGEREEHPPRTNETHRQLRSIFFIPKNKKNKDISLYLFILEAQGEIMRKGGFSPPLHYWL